MMPPDENIRYNILADSDREALALILLAAGNSRRFKSNKLLHRIEGDPMYLHIVKEIEKLPEDMFVSKIIVTQYPSIEQEMKKRGYRVIRNPHSEWGISHSIQLGLTALYNENQAVAVDGICFAVCDQPYLTAQTINRLAETWRLSKKGIACLKYLEQTGNPVIFHRKYKEELMDLKGDTGGKKVLNRHKQDVAYCELPNGKELEDVDCLST